MHRKNRNLLVKMMKQNLNFLTVNVFIKKIDQQCLSKSQRRYGVTKQRRRSQMSSNIKFVNPLMPAAFFK